MVSRISIQIMLAVLPVTLHCNLTFAAKPSPNFEVASYAEQWQDKSVIGKANYLAGFCEGGLLMGGNKIATLSCSEVSTLAKASSNRNHRMCGVLAGDPRKAIQLFDEFYSLGDHSDLPTWVAAAAFNDKACSEDFVSSRMTKIQSKNKCDRILMNLAGGGGMAPEAIKKQQEYCGGLGK